MATTVVTEKLRAIVASASVIKSIKLSKITSESSATIISTSEGKTAIHTPQPQKPITKVKKEVISELEDKTAPVDVDSADVIKVD